MVTTTVSKSRFKAQALAYFREVEQTGREIVITDRGTPVLKLVPYRPDPEAALRVLRDTVVRYEAPTEPVGDDEWGVGPVIVLDTHALVWWLASPDRIPRKARARLARAAGEGEVLSVSSISAWEVAMLVARGRLKLTMDVDAWIAAAEALPLLEFRPVDNAVALRAVGLPDTLPRDPADRIIAATALGLGATLVTGDERLRGYRPLRTLWN